MREIRPKNICEAVRPLLLKLSLLTRAPL